MNKQTTTEQDLAHCAAGAEHFPVAAPAPSSVPLHPRGCTRCPLGSPGSSTAWYQNPQHQPLMVIAGIHTSPPEANGPQKTQTFPPEAAVLERLLHKLGVGDQCHRSLAIKCPATRGVPSPSLQACNGYLQREILEVNPQVILAFGSLAWAAVAMALGLKNFDVSMVFQSVIKKGAYTIVALPSVLELTHYPQWRTTVWTTLQGVVAHPTQRP